MEYSLSDYPVKINDVPIPYGTFTFSPETLENVYQSETGKDILQIKRLGKGKYNFTLKLTHEWVPILYNFSVISSPLSVEIYDIGLQQYVTKQMRMRDFQDSLARKSDRLKGSYGIYDITFSLIEF